MAHATAGVLSQNIPTCECCRQIGLMFSRTSQARKTPAISRFEILIGPHLFAAETRFALMSAGHSYRHTVGWMCLVPFIHTPPTPNLDASTYAMNHGVSPVISSTDVGLDDMRCNRTTQSRSACWSDGVSCMMSLVPFIALLNGDMRPLPLGRPMHA